MKWEIQLGWLAICWVSLRSTQPSWLLIAQSIAEPPTLLTNEPLLARYSDGVRVV